MSEERINKFAENRYFKEKAKDHLRELLVQDEKIEKLKARIKELKQKEAELSELKEGLPIEKANKEEVYFFVSPAGLIWRVTWSEPDQEWLTRSAHDRDYEPLRVNRVYPLPTQISETQEGS